MIHRKDKVELMTLSLNGSEKVHSKDKVKVMKPRNIPEKKRLNYLV